MVQTLNNQNHVSSFTGQKAPRMLRGGGLGNGPMSQLRFPHPDLFMSYLLIFSTFVYDIFFKYN